jgi:hypothetical protein
MNEIGVPLRTRLVLPTFSRWVAVDVAVERDLLSEIGGRAHRLDHLRLRCERHDKRRDQGGPCNFLEFAHEPLHGEV